MQARLLLQEMIDSSANAMLLAGADGRICAANAACADLFGWTIGELLARYVDDLVPPRFRENHRDGRNRFDGRPCAFGGDGGLCGLRSDATEFDAEISLGAVVGDKILVTIGDVTRRERPHAALDEREEQMRIFIDHVPVALAMFDREMRFLSASRCWRTLYGLDGRDLQGRLFYDVMPDVPQGWRSAHRHALEGAVERVEEERLDRADGTVRWLRWEARPWRSDAGGIGGLILFTEDVTARKQIEEDRERLRHEIDRQRALLQTVVDTIPAGLALLVGDDFRVALANAAQANLVGGDGPVVGRAIADVWTGLLDSGGQRPLEHARRSGEAVHRTDLPVMVERGGHREEAFFDIDFVPVRNETGQVAGLLLVSSESTERVRDRRKIREKDAAIHRLRSEMERTMAFQVASQTVAAIAHDLKQPLTAVLAYSEAALSMVQAGNPRPERLRQALQAGAAQAERAGRSVDELMQFFRKSQAEMEPVLLQEVAAEALSIVEGDASDELQASLEATADLRPVRANRQQVQKVFVNLLRNGAQAMSGAGTPSPSISITIASAPKGNEAVVTVRDTGPGLDAARLNRVFEPFYTTKPEGLGMGLTISRSIVERHGGRLWCENEAGAGAAFHFTMPFVD
jgi:PAS domain S-box-containing protein